MRSANHLLLTACFIFFLGCHCKSQNNKSKNVDYDSGYKFFWNYKKDSAFLMFNRYVNNPDDSFRKGSAYKYMGEIQWSIGDLYGAEESLTIAIHTLDSLKEQQHLELGIAYSLLGNVNLDLKLYNEAIQFYKHASTLVKDREYLLDFMNGMAVAFQKMGKYKEAIAIYDSILAFKSVDQGVVARIIDNRARTKWLQDPGYHPLAEFWSALKIRTDNKNNLGLNASYAHLSDYYTRSNPDSALWYAKKMREQAIKNQNPDDILEAIDKIIRLNKSPVVKEKWYEEYKTLNDSLQFSRDTTKNRFAMIRYDFQKSKADNLSLSYAVEKSKADNLTLQQDNTRQRLLLYGLIVLAVAVVTGLITWFSKRRKRMKQESENAIRDSKLKTSQKVHDVVANGLYGIMNELEHGKLDDREPLITKIESLYEKSRNISYEVISSGNNAGDELQIPHLLSSFANEHTNVILVGNEQKFWNKITGDQKHELYLILNEVMINMKKHSRAKNVVVMFKQEGSKCFITYKDDGAGFDPDLKFGNGLNNTVSRIKSLNGEINFGKSEKEGALIAISFPLESSKA